MPENGQIKRHPCIHFLFLCSKLFRASSTFPIFHSCYIRNTSTFLKVMEGKSILPTNLNDIPKFKSDTSKWVYFFANLTEEVWIPLKEVFEADYRRHLCVKMINDGLAVAAGAEETKVHILYTFIHTLLLENHFVLLFVKQTDAPPVTVSADETKIAAKIKPRSSRQRSKFTNMQHLHPSFQNFILQLPRKSFQMIFPSIIVWVWVSIFVFSIVLLTFPISKLTPYVLVFRKLLTSILSVFWDWNMRFDWYVQRCSQSSACLLWFISAIVHPRLQTLKEAFWFGNIFEKARFHG